MNSIQQGYKHTTYIHTCIHTHTHTHKLWEYKSRRREGEKKEKKQGPHFTFYFSSTKRGSEGVECSMCLLIGQGRGRKRNRERRRTRRKSTEREREGERAIGSLGERWSSSSMSEPNVLSCLLWVQDYTQKLKWALYQSQITSPLFFKRR